MVNNINGSNAIYDEGGEISVKSTGSKRLREDFAPTPPSLNLESSEVSPLTPERITGSSDFTVFFDTDEIRVVVLSNLSPKDLKSFSLTSRNYRQMAEEEIVRRLNEKKNTIYDFFPNFLNGFSFLEKHCKKIKNLFLKTNKDFDFSLVFQKFKNLERIQIDGQICTATFAAYFLNRTSKTFKSFNIRNSNLEDFSFLENSAIEELLCENTHPTDLNFLPKCLHLKHFSLTKISKELDFTPIFACKSITFLDLRETKIASISGIENLKLEYLGLTNCKSILDFTPLKNKTLGISWLNLTGTNFADINMILNLPLKILNLSNCANIQDFSPLKQSTSLHELGINNTHFNNLQFIKDLSLTKLGIGQCNKLNNFFLLSSIKSIRSLNLPKNCSNINFIEHLPFLEELGLDSESIIDMSPLKHCFYLKNLSFKCAKVMTDIDFLKNCKLLNKLSITYNPGGYINVTDLKNFKYLNCFNSNIKDNNNFENSQSGINKFHRLLLKSSIDQNLTSNPKFIKFLYKLARQGDRHAQFSLAVNILVKSDAYEAFYFIKLSAEQGYLPAINALGYCYDTGNGCQKDEQKAFELYKYAAEKNHSSAKYNLGLCYLNGKGVEKNLKNALHWFFLAAPQHSKAKEAYDKLFNEIQQKALDGDTESQNLVAECYKNHKKDEKEAFRFYNMSAQKGDPTGLCNLGIFYETGYGVKVDAYQFFNALVFYQQSANLGNEIAKNNLAALLQKQLESASKNDSSAQFTLGLYYAKIGNYQEGIRYLRLSAEQNHTEAQHYLANALESNPETRLEAIQLYHYLSKVNVRALNDLKMLIQKMQVSTDLLAHYHQGYCAEFGIGMEANHFIALSNYDLSEKKGNPHSQAAKNALFNKIVKSAEQGDPLALYTLGKCYHTGAVTAINFDQAVFYYKLAADKGCGDAEYNLALCFEYGLGAKTNLEAALFYYDQAAKKKIFLAHTTLNTLFQKVKSAAESNQPESLRLYGYCLEKGICVKKSLVQAKEYYRKAEIASMIK